MKHTISLEEHCARTEAELNFCAVFLRTFVSPVLLARAGQNFEVTLDVGQGERAKSAEIIEEKDDQRSEQQQADPPQVCGHCNPAGEP